MKVLGSLQDNDSINESHGAQESCQEKVSCWAQWYDMV